MAGVSVPVEKSILKWVMQKSENEMVSNSVTDMLSKWISGEKIPTFNQLETVSKKLHIPFGYFLLSEPPIEECRIVDFRTVDSERLSNPSRNLIDTLDQMYDVQAWMSDYNKDNLESYYSFVGRASKNRNVYYVLNDILKELDLSKEWFRNYRSAADAFRFIRSKLTELGILVMMNGIVGNNTHRRLDVEEFRAFTLVDLYAPLIFINSADADNGKLFSILHELVHVWIGQNSFYNDFYGNAIAVSKDEQFCNAVAAEILVPQDIFETEWDKQNGDERTRIESLEKVFVCSRMVLLRRALSTKRITTSTYKELASYYQVQYNKFNQSKKKSSGGDFYRSLNVKWDKRFIKAIATSAESGQTPYSDVYKLTNTNGKTFSELVGRAGGTL